MKSSLINAKEELKRVDHLIFVTLRYCRTCDVVRSVIERIVSTYDELFNALLKNLKDKGQIDDIPQFPAMICETLKSVMEDPVIIDNIDFYLFLRKILRQKYLANEEFRRNISMTVEFNNKVFIINIDALNEYYDKAMAFFDYVSELLLK